jgi:polyhydroxyalkanoate synthesis regulator phasin
MKRMGRVGTCLSLIAGACIGTFAFLVLGAIIAAKPIREGILSAHGILVSSKPIELTAEQSFVITDLLKQGALISSNDLLTNVSSFYSTMIQVLIATFFVFGALSYFAIQANARRQIEEISDPLIGKAVASHFNSVQFDKEVISKVQSSLQIELENYENRMGDLEENAERVGELERRVQELSSKNEPAPEEE